MDIDKQILALEGKSVMVSLNSKSLFLKIGISLVLSLVFMYALRPYYLLNIEPDNISKKCVAKLNMKYYALSSFIFTGIFYYVLQPIFSDNL